MSGTGGGTQVGGLYVSLSGETSSLNRSMSEARGEMDQAEESMDRVDQKARALEGAFLAAAAGATAAALALREIAQVGMDVEQTFSIVQAASQASSAEMDMMRDVAQDLGAEMPLYLSDIAQGFEQLVYSGMSAAEAIEAVDSVSRLAVSGQLQLAESSRIVTSALNAFNMSAEQAGSVADGLSAVFASSATSIQEAGQALDYTSAAAASAGQNITQTNAAIAALADNGIRGSRAGTSLQAALTSIVAPSSKAADALESVGLSTQSFVDEEGNVKDFAEIIRTLEEATEGLTEAERAAFLSDVFGARGQRAIAPLISDVEALDEKLQSIAGADIVGSFEELEGLDTDELEERFSGSAVQITPGMNQEEMIAQYVEAGEEMTEEELQAEIQATLNVDSGAAEIFAENIAASESAEELSESLDEVTTSTDLNAARMESLSGQLMYAAGSMQSFAYSAYLALEPVFMLGGAALVNLVDLLNSNAAIAETFGVALLALGTAATVAAAGLAAMIAQMKIQTALSGGAATSTYAYAAAQSTLAASTRAATSAQWLMTASTTQLIARLQAGRVAALAAGASKITLAGAATTAAGAMGTAATAALGLLAALGPIGWIALGLVAAWAAWKSGLLDFIGIGQEAEMVASAIGSTLSWLAGLFGIAAGEGGSFLGTLGKILGIFVKILALPISLPISYLGAAIRNAQEPVSTLAGHISWLTDRLSAAHVIMAAFPPLAIAAFFWKIAGGADGMKQAFMGAISPLVRLHGMLKSIIGLVPELEEIPIIGTLVSNMDEGTGVLESKSEGVAGTIASYLPSSDAERGPLANLTEQGAALPKTFASGMENADSVLTNTARSLMGQLVGNENPLGGLFGGATPQTPISPPTPGMGGAQAATAGGGTQSTGGRQRPPRGAQGGQGGSNISVRAEVNFNGSGGSIGISREEVNRIAENHTRDLAEAINQARREMAGEQ